MNFCMGNSFPQPHGSYMVWYSSIPHHHRIIEHECDFESQFWKCPVSNVIYSFTSTECVSHLQLVNSMMLVRGPDRHTARGCQQHTLSLCRHLCLHWNAKFQDRQCWVSQLIGGICTRSKVMPSCGNNLLKYSMSWWSLWDPDKGRKTSPIWDKARINKKD